MAHRVLYVAGSAHLDPLLTGVALARLLAARGVEARVLTPFARTFEVEAFAAVNLVRVPPEKLATAWPRYARAMDAGAVVLDGVDRPGDLEPALAAKVHALLPPGAAPGPNALVLAAPPGLDLEELGEAGRRGLLRLVGKHSPWMKRDAAGLAPVVEALAP